MGVIRFRSRHLHATVVTYVRTHLDTLGWISAPVNFETQPVTVVDYQPEERTRTVAPNTVAVSLGDYGVDEDEELGAATIGGLRSATYSIFTDVYMSEQALSYAICDDIRDIFTDLTLPLVNQITGEAIPGCQIEFVAVHGPTRPQASVGAEQFKQHWRIMHIETVLYFPT